ncbi:B-box zinc finger protein 20-like [Actinidia eriantha]|uniref:B-box zinc finger protein 20-like n=1 Tax=Actinidia eriantha TaxID=165200 RepID=UPI00258CF6F5|nr:B-box zinc finger protein 20-like [Actinidia eriantha]
MKIQCDVCNEQEASVFCPADEAALCNNCDNRVHDANKLAGKHTRFSLLHPSLKEYPRCDICQERRAFLFCQEDRAILCRECDIPIHRANELTEKHKRFLLTGLKLSPSSSSSSSSSASASSIDSEIKCSISDQLCSPSLTDNKAILASSTSTRIRADDAHCGRQLESSVMSASSISEYLMETLPGWRVDDFLDPSSSPHGFCKVCITPSTSFQKKLIHMIPEKVKK